MAKTKVKRRTRRASKKAGIDWRGHIIDMVKYFIPILLVTGFGMYVAIEKMQTQNEANKTFYSEKFEQSEKNQTNLTNWLKYINEKLDKHLSKD